MSKLRSSTPESKVKMSSEIDKALLSRLEALNLKIRSLIPRREWSEEALSSMLSCQEKTGYLNGRQVRRLIMVLTPRGCEYCLKTGGCFMCGEVAGSTLGLSIPAKYHIVQFIKEYANRQAWRIPWIMVYNEGNILYNEEVSPVARRVIFGTLIGNGHERITIEARPEYITPQKLMELRNIELDLKQHKSPMEIGLGLEVADERIRAYCIHKGFSNAEYERTVKVIKSYGMRALTYVFVKPPFLTEREAIDVAIDTVKYAFKTGSDAVSLELASIHSYTLLEYLGDNFRPPWLWSAIEIAKETNHLGEIRIGGEPGTYYPHSSKSAYNCELCTEPFWRTIKQFEITPDIKIFDAIRCKCKEKWIKELEKDNPLPLEERITSILDKLSFDAYAARKKQEVGFK